MRTEFIQTKIRPIKKLFIIEKNDYDTFLNIVKEIHNEIDVIQNLFLQNDESLYSGIIKAFIKRHDPDVILNLTSIDDDIISKHFDTWCVKPISDKYKIRRFGTDLMCFTNLPILAKKFKTDLSFKVYAYDKLEKEPFSILAVMNYGYIGKKEDLHLDMTIFKEIEIEIIKNPQIVKNNLFNRDKQFFHLTTALGSGSANGTSIWEIDHNKQQIYENNKYIFVASLDDLSALVYFWNTRATYNYSNLFWLPEELFKEYSELIDNNTTLVCFSNNVEDNLRSETPNLKIIKPERYYFRGYSDRWRCFEYDQHINIESDEVLLQHPADRCFSDIGLGGACVLEIRGIKEFIYPSRRNIGNLYKPDHLYGDLFSERFFRISSKGLSIYVIHFDPMDTTGLTSSFKLPSFDSVLYHIMSDSGYEIKKTVKSSIVDQLLNLMGGISEINLLCQKTIFNLILSLTPTVRTENAIKRILGNKTNNMEDIISLIGKAKETRAIEFPDMTLNVEQLLSKSRIDKQERLNFLNTLQKMYDKQVLLRGKSFTCPHCARKVWFTLEGISHNNCCHDCGNKVQIPIHIEGKTESDSYRLNQLVVRAVDQGQLSTLLLLNFYSTQKYWVFDALTNLEVYREHKLITDIDIFLRIGNKLGLAECKSKSGFDNQQIDKLIGLAKETKCDFVSLSCLLDRENREIAEIKRYIEEKNIDIPVFIFTEEVLFNPFSIKFNKYFECFPGNKFKTGPIIVE